MRFRRVGKEELEEFVRRHGAAGCKFLVYIYWRSKRKHLLQNEEVFERLYLRPELIEDAERIGVIRRTPNGFVLNAKCVYKFICEEFDYHRFEDGARGFVRPPMFFMPVRSTVDGNTVITRVLVSL